jgi:sugar phosphate isomerase/epimerase
MDDSESPVADLTRRRMLVGGLGLAAGAASGAAAWAAPWNSRHGAAQWPCGVQLFSVAAELSVDLPGTLASLKTRGYETVETAGLLGLSARQLRARIEDAGLKCRSMHANMADLVGKLEQTVQVARDLGATWLVCASPQPPQPLDARQDWVAAMIAAMTPDAWKANAAHLADIAPAVARSGLKLAYHNHPMEFIDLGNGTCGYDLLVAAASPQELRLELDLGWVFVGGRDPASMIRKYAGRVDLLHVKDMVKDPSSPTGFRSVEVGRGLIDWRAVFEAAHAAKVQGYFVEQEAPFKRPILDSLAMSREYLRKV